MIDANGKSVVTVKKTELLEVMKKNLAGHRATFEEATKGYRIEVIKQLEISLADAHAGRKIRRQIDLLEPVDQSKDYVRVITMLEMSVDNEIRVTEREFAQYVLDDWDWKGQFESISSAYMVK